MSAQTKPTLHEIAAMPFPASVSAMRQHYDPAWGTDPPEGETRLYTVQVSYSYTGDDVWETEIEASSAEEAEKLAEEAFDKADLDLPAGADVDAIEDVEATVSAIVGASKSRGL